MCTRIAKAPDEFFFLGIHAEAREVFRVGPRSENRNLYALLVSFRMLESRQHIETVEEAFNFGGGYFKRPGILDSTNSALFKRIVSQHSLARYEHVELLNEILHICRLFSYIRLGLTIKTHGYQS